MRIGIGGGIGPFKGGISTRGIGLGVGPVSVGTGWRSSSHRKGNPVSDAVGEAISVGILGLLVYALAWWLWNLSPWLVSTGIVLVVIGVVLAIRTHFHRRHLAREEAWRFAEDERRFAAYQQELFVYENQLQSLAREADAARRQADEVATLAADYRDAVEALPRYPQGRTGDELGLPEEVPDGLRVVGIVGQVGLSAPRVQYPGGPKVQTKIANGSVVITDEAVQFLSETREQQWPLKRIRSVSKEEGRLLISLAGRQTVSGLTGDALSIDLLWALIAWARALPGSSPDILPYLIKRCGDAELASSRALALAEEAKSRWRELMDTPPPSPDQWGVDLAS